MTLLLSKQASACRSYQCKKKNLSPIFPGSYLKIPSFHLAMSGRQYFAQQIAFPLRKGNFLFPVEEKQRSEQLNFTIASPLMHIRVCIHELMC